MASSNKIDIIIAATDKATAVLKQVNGQINRMSAPVRRLGQSLSNVANQSGLSSMAKRVAAVGKSVMQLSSKVLALAGPLAAIFGGASVYGLYEMISLWARWGLEIAKASQTIGITSGQLQSLHGAAGLAGISAESLTSGLKTLGDTMQDARWGRNQQALVVMSRLGMKFRQTKEGAIDVTQSFMDLSKAIASIKNPQVQGLVARSFGVEALLPLLRKGPAAIRAWQQQAQKLGAVQSNQQIASAERFAASLQYLKLAATGVQNAIAAKLVPALQPLLEKLAAWLSNHRELIATKFTAFVLAVANGTVQFFRVVKDLVESLGGWQQALKDLAILMGIGLVTNLALVIAKLGWMVISWRAVTAAATAAAAAQTAATGAMGAGAAGAAASAGLGASASAGLGALASRTGALFGRIGLPAYLLTHSESLNSGEDEWVRKKLRVPVGIRNNNPMNLRSWGKTPVVDGFAKFATMHDGLVANVKNLIYAQSKHGMGNLDQVINRWAPRADGNNTERYINAVQRDTGLGRYQSLNLRDPSTLQAIVPAMIKQEVGGGHVNAQEIASAINDALKTIKIEVNGANMPQGTQINATSGDGSYLPSRINYSSLALGISP